MMAAPITVKPVRRWNRVASGRRGPRASWSLSTWRDAYVAVVAVAAGLLFVRVATNPTSEPWQPVGVVALFVAMLVTERMSVPLPKDAAVSIATIPHIMAVLLLPAWLTMSLAAGSMLLDQLFARAGARKSVFNVASVALTTGAAALVADHVGLGREGLAVNTWHQVPSFLLVAGTYYVLTNSLLAVVLSLSGRKPVGRVLIENARFVLPAEFAVCGIGGLVTIVWVLDPAWAPLVLFPAAVSQVAYQYVTSSKRNQSRLAFIAEASRVLGLSLDQRELAERTVQLCVPRLGDAAMLCMPRDDGTLGLVAYAAADGHGDSSLIEPAPTDALAAWARTVAGRVAVEGRTCVLSSTEMPSGAGGESTSFRSAVVTILRCAERTHGSLILLSGSDGAYSSGDVGVVEELAQRCSAGLANAKLHAEAQRATRLRDEFLSVAAHELKTPVTSLRGYAQLLQREGAMSRSGLLTKGLHTIELQTARLTELTAKLLDVSRIDAGKLQLEMRTTDLSLLVRDAVLEAQHNNDEHALRVTTCGPCQVSVDPVRIEQVITNLLGNAIKYSPNGGTIEVALERVGSDAVHLEIRDHGVGIPPERRDRLFERLYQAHGDGYLSGLGLGLFISKQIVELHGGAIEAQFPVDGGTRMIVTLPVR
jgi:signal transduction histidine kinase